MLIYIPFRTEAYNKKDVLNYITSTGKHAAINLKSHTAV